MIFKSVVLFAVLAVGWGNVEPQHVVAKRQDTPAGAVAGAANQVLETIDALSEQFKVMVLNTMAQSGNSINVKCASKQNDIGWHTLQPGQAVGWGFRQSAGLRTCFWCYINNNGQDARSSNKWYMHFNAWGNGKLGCGGAPADVPDDSVTRWEIRDDGAYSNGCAACNGGQTYEKYTSWGPPPS